VIIRAVYLQGESWKAGARAATRRRATWGRTETTWGRKVQWLAIS